VIRRKTVFLSALALLAASVGQRASADVVTGWDFNNLPIAVNNNPASDLGVRAGSATSLGMTNNYNYTQTPPDVGSVTTDDILALTGSSDPVAPASANNAWRVRGQNPGNGWNLAAPQYSQGVEFDVSTTGYSGIVLKFDWFTTNQGIRDMQVHYTSDGSTWNNAGGLLGAVPNGYINGNTVDFGALGITSVNNDSAFGVRLVSAYDPALTHSYASASLSGSGAVQVYNNNSGNWRFDMVTISGTALVPAVPEPSIPALAAIGGIGLLMARRRRRAR
jgi:hypothetical protein